MWEPEEMKWEETKEWQKFIVKMSNACIEEKEVKERRKTEPLSWYTIGFVEWREQRKWERERESITGPCGDL